MTTHSVKISNDACQSCVNCIKQCPTEAIRIVDGEMNILPELCIDCGECLRICKRSRALGISEDDWSAVSSKPMTLVPDPVTFLQFGHHDQPEKVEALLKKKGFNCIIDDLQTAFDLHAYATMRLIEEASRDSLPYISVYCPSVLRLIESRFQELLPHVLPIRSPLEIAVDLYRERTGDKEKSALLSPCPSKITMIHEPQGVDYSPIDYGVTVRRAVRSLMASGSSIDGNENLPKRSNRWIAWARRGGESMHVKAFAHKRLKTIDFSGIRNTTEILQDLELGKLRGVDFIELRVCDTGCVGGVGTADSRFLATLRCTDVNIDWDISAADKRRVENLFQMREYWSTSKEYEPRLGIPLSNNITEAMAKLQQVKEVYRTLPHIDCGSCGRPSCQAMAEEIVRGHGSAMDCVFKLREGIGALAGRIYALSESPLHTIKRSGINDKNK